MNLFTLNGATINGSAGALVIAAAAAIAASCSISVNASRGVVATSGVSSGAQVTANVTYTARGAAALAGNGSVAAVSRHVQAGAAATTCTADITAFLLREISAEASLSGSAELQVIPASTLGSASISGAATLIPEATKVHPGRAGIGSVAGVTFTPEPVVTRFVSASTFGNAQVRVESALNGVQDAYATIRGQASVTVPDAGIVFRQSVAVISPTTNLVPAATKIQPGHANAPALAALVVTEPFISNGGAASIFGTANVTANSTRIRRAQAAVSGASSVSAGVSVRHAAAGLVTGTGAVSSNARRTTFSSATISGSASVFAAEIRIVLAEAALSSAGSLLVNAMATRPAGSSLSGTAQFDAVPDTTVRQGEAAISGASEAVSAADVERFALADISGSADTVADGEVTILGEAEPITGTCAIVADTQTNVDSFDPTERTFSRPAYAANFTRFAQITQFRRAA